MKGITDARQAVKLLNYTLYDKECDVVIDPKNDSYMTEVYDRTNEQIPEYLNKLNVKGNTLTITGSGDQVLYSVLNGAENIDTFDINRMAYYMLQLKKSAILGVDKDKYLEFFGGNYNKAIYDMFKAYLPESARKFWDYLYKSFDNDGKKIKLIKRTTKNHIPEKDHYTSKYEDLREGLKVSNINFYPGNFTLIHNDLKDNKNKYKLIMLSNIYDYFYDLSVSDYIASLRRNYFPLLDKDGVILYHYYFNNPKTLGRDISLDEGDEEIKLNNGHKVKVLRKSDYYGC